MYTKLEKKKSIILVVFLMLSNLILLSFLDNIMTTSDQEANKVEKLEIKSIESGNLQDREIKETGVSVLTQADNLQVPHAIEYLSMEEDPIFILQILIF